MTFATDKFYGGLTVGVLIGLALHTIVNYIFKTNCTSQDKKSVVESQQQAPKSLPNKNGEFKIALLVRHDLKMGKGKVAAQCSHAIVHCYEEGLRLKPREIKSWESNNKPVNIFKVADEETMLEFQKLAIEKGFTTYVVVDAGRTQVAPRSKTVMAIGPVEKECAVVSVTANNKTKLRNLPSQCARVVLRAPDLKTLECVQKQCKLFDIPTATFTENNEMTVLAIGPANEASINAQVHSLKLY
ncbi:peptidyl-tRNA hydrolase 2, mitochondrial-like isoform X1 [Myzus persicae]|uniref:peptidyl-tRNA hydrolase 2, mitochondrial-like isoform X1 n=1 Tax=Myzus persicae TaxID=13164 RepID=UPI000B932FED|nr:peptidyl-tRNA hydrolase 2, mitochondrial-like isoform X1 [Myzus persicae]